MSQIGGVVSVHRARLLHKTWGVFAAALMAGGMWWARSAMSPTRPGLVLLLTIGFTLVAVWFAVAWWRHRSLRITAYQHGLGWTIAGKQQLVHFTEIAQVSHTSINGRPVALHIDRHTGQRLTVSSDVTEHQALLAHLATKPATNLPSARALR